MRLKPEIVNETDESLLREIHTSEARIYCTSFCILNMLKNIVFIRTLELTGNTCTYMYISVSIAYVA